MTRSLLSSTRSGSKGKSKDTDNSTSAPGSENLISASSGDKNNTNSDFDNITESLEEVSGMIAGLQPKGAFETSCKKILQILNKHVLLLSTSCGAMSNSVDAVEVNVAKTDQYSRRDTVVVTGLDYNPETETHSELTGAVAGEMSKSGVQVNASDFSACHRNGKKFKQFNRNGRSIKVPPTVTVRFLNSHKKDNLLANYKNYENGKPKKVKIVQSLNYHYQDLKNSISNICKECDVSVKWIHWRSASAGLCVKLKDGRFISKIHCMTDFRKQLFVD